MSEALRVLLVEDSEGDALLVLRALRKEGYAPAHARVDTAAAMRAALAGGEWDVILADYRMPEFGGLEALAIANADPREIPFILVSGTIGEEAAVDLMKAGAHDVVMKDRLSRLGPVLKRELADAAARRGMKRAQIEWAAAFDAVQDPIFIHDGQFRVVRANLAYAALAGMPIRDVIGKPYWQVFPRRDGPLPACSEAGEGGGGKPAEDEFTLPDGAHYASRAFPIGGDAGDGRYTLHALQDVTERDRVHDALARNERRYRKILEGGADVIVLLDASGRVISRSPVGAELTGRSDAEVAGREYASLVVAEDLPRLTEELGRVSAQAGATARAEFRIRRKDGTPLPIEAVARNLLGDEDVGAIVLTWRDISERKRAEKALLKTNRALATLSAGNEALVRAGEETALLAAMCGAIVEAGAYRHASVAYAREAAGAMEVVASKASAPGSAGDARIAPDADAAIHDALARALGTGERQLRSCEAGSVVVFPLQLGGAAAALSIASAEPAGFDEVELQLLKELSENLAFGIAAARDRAHRRVSAERLRESLVSTIEAISATVERRDPYTAGHERRVAVLAVAIAEELGLRGEAVEGVRFGAMIHDLGKIQIPAEILSKPGKLNDIEFQLIKEHPATGFEILKGIAFPWPVAQMVLQHHERLDGTGYPNGDKGDAIILEARILSVADVVEAMSSRRPYRPELGIDAALKQIEAKRGLWFDPAVVDACLRLFRDKGFVLEPRAT